MKYAGTPERLAEVYADARRVVAADALWKSRTLSQGLLARRLGVPQTLLSEALSAAGSSFNALVNGFRVEAADSLLRRRPELTLRQVAEMSGYASVNVFSEHFKSCKGCRPSDVYGKRMKGIHKGGKTRGEALR